MAYRSRRSPRRRRAAPRRSYRSSRLRRRTTRSGARYSRRGSRAQTIRLELVSSPALAPGLGTPSVIGGVMHREGRAKSTF